MHSNFKKIMTIAAGAAFVLPAVASADMDTPKPVAQKKSANSAMFTLHAQAPNVAPDGTASFVIDLSGLNPFQFLKLLKSDRTVIVFRDEPAQPESLCPYFELAAHQYEVRQIDPEKTIYRINAKISNDEVEKIKKAGCMITKTISRHEIKPYQP